MAATIPKPINKTPATAASKVTMGTPPVLGNTVLSVLVAPTVAVGVALCASSTSLRFGSVTAPNYHRGSERGLQNGQISITQR